MSFGDLRSYLHRQQNATTPPDSRAWSALCTLLDEEEAAQPTRFADELLPYAEGLLSSWPDAVRQPPQRWVVAASQGHAPLSMSLIRVFRYPAWRPTPLELSRLISSSAMRGVRELDLRDNALVPEHLDILKRAQHLTQLESIDLSGNHPDAACMRDMLNAPWVGKLRALELRACELGPEGVEVICESDAAPRLERLNLLGNRIGSEGARALARTKRLSSLTSLNLVLNRLGDAGVELLTGASWLSHVTSLDLAYDEIGGEGARQLVANPVDSRLLSLDLANNSIGPEGAQALATASELHNLRRLDLSFNRLGDEGGQAFANACQLPALRSLNMGFDELSDLTARAVANNNSLKMLDELWLEGNRIGDAGAQRLVSALSSIRVLDLRQNRPITPMGSHMLKNHARANPELRLLL
jgi:Ran GTPase-activating protein (RanGAP) involved in mRNA processing and transport